MRCFHSSALFQTPTLVTMETNPPSALTDPRFLLPFSPPPSPGEVLADHRSIEHIDRHPDCCLLLLLLPLPLPDSFPCPLRPCTGRPGSCVGGASRNQSALQLAACPGGPCTPCRLWGALLLGPLQAGPGVGETSGRARQPGSQVQGRVPAPGWCLLSTLPYTTVHSGEQSAGHSAALQGAVLSCAWHGGVCTTWWSVHDMVERAQHGRA